MVRLCLTQTFARDFFLNYCNFKIYLLKYNTFETIFKFKTPFITLIITCLLKDNFQLNSLKTLYI